MRLRVLRYDTYAQRDVYVFGKRPTNKLNVYGKKNTKETAVLPAKM